MSRKRKTGLKTVLADTGVLYALGDPKDERRREALRLVESLRSEGQVTVCIPAHVILELHRLRLYRKPFAPGVAWREVNAILERFALEHPVPEDFTDAWAQLARFPDQRITFSDALTASMAARLGARILTFDRHFGLLGSSVVA